jgi:hypothetical protein
MRTNPNIILSGNRMAQPELPDVNAMMQTRTAGMENIYGIEQQRAAQAQAAQKEQAAAQETATLKALLPAYTYGIQTGDIAGAGNLVPPEMRPQIQQYIDALTGKSPEEVKSALIGSLSSSQSGQEALAAIQRAETIGVQRGQLDVSRQRLAMEEGQLGMPAPMSAADQARIELEERRVRIAEENAAREAAKTEAIASGEAPPVELQKGEVWNEAEQRVEAVPGSTTYIKQKSSHGKDFQGAINVDRQLQDVQDAVTDVMNTSGWQKWLGTGAVMGRLPNVPIVSDVFSGGYDFTRKMKNLEGAVKTLGRTDASASGKLGNMAVQEWRFVADAIANLDLTNMGAADLNDQLEIIMSKAQEMRGSLRTGYDEEWGGSQFYAPLPETKYRGGGGGGGGGGAGGETDAELDALLNQYLPQQ